MKKILKILVMLSVFISVINLNFTSIHAQTLIWPVPGHKNLSQGFHNGNAIDISDGRISGANVVAAMSGTVTHKFTCTSNHYPNLGDCYGFGTGIVIKGSDGRIYQYAHMYPNSIPSNVYVGAYVSAGQKIGQVGNTGNSTGSHLHFGISLGNYWNASGINPAKESYSDYAASMVVPTISTDKSSYLVGDTVHMSWAASPANSNLSHYWLQIKSPNGSLILNARMDKKTSYSFIVNSVGNYELIAWATPIGSVSGEGSLTAKKTITVNPKIPQPGKSVLKVSTGDSKKATNFSWTKTSNTDHYDLRIYRNGSNTAYKSIFNIKSNSYSIVLPEGNYRADVASVAKDNNVFTSSNAISFKIITAPTQNKDGWYYVNELPSYVTSDKYTIEYQNHYEKVQKTSPGTGWKNVGTIMKYENSGNPYWSTVELPTSDTRVLINYYYYHWCGTSGNSANYEANSKYPHFDSMSTNLSSSLKVAESGPDWENAAYRYYKLKGADGNLVYCASGITCDGKYGTHGKRTYIWYKHSQYQNKVKVTYYKFTKDSGWVTKKDSSANSVKYRYKLKNKYTDVSNKSWYYSTVKEISDLGLMTGTDASHFSPNQKMSRGMVATVLHRMAGTPSVAYKKIFSDVPKGKYYSNAVTWAANKKIISGYKDGRFGPGDNITRQDMAVILYNYASKYGANMNKTKDLSSFKDKNMVSSYAQKAMKWAVGNGIISGTSDGKLNPKASATRAECAKMFLQTYELVGFIS